MNHLEKEKSPYLIQHRENPVDWYPWGKEAFDRALREDKPVFLSIGYSTCHWCHVMAHESFEDTEVAELLNREFVCIKVDREERPDVDAVYMEACQMMTGSGGWPLTVLMTPEQKPFFAGTYFPKNDRFGRPGLIQLLERASELWKTERDSLLETGDKIAAVVAEVPPAPSSEPDRELLRQAYQTYTRQFDETWGGFGAAPKFPVPHNLMFLLQYSFMEHTPEARQMVERTLSAMAEGGICDQIGGGFSRYSTDPKWLAPHFEKMLYDNALLALAYLDAYQATGRDFYAEVARRTLDYMLRELQDPRGGFYSGQDADSEGIEGKYYLWTREEILQVLGREVGERFCSRYDITEDGNFEGKNIPNRIVSKEEPFSAEDPSLKRLYDYRRSRTSLHRDDKILLAWNGWAMAALARAGRVLREDRYLDAALRCWDFVEANMIGMDGRLSLRWKDGEAAQMGQLDDYAVLAFALLELYDATFDPIYLLQATYRAVQMEDWFEDQENGGYYKTASDAETLIARLKETYDGAIPSGNSVAGAVWVRLAKYTGENKYQEAAGRQLRFLAGAVSQSPAGHGFALWVLGLALAPSRELVCASSFGLPEPLEAYRRESFAAGLTTLLKTAENAGRLALAAPFTASYPVPEQGVVYYLCQNGACAAPVTDWNNLNL